MPQEYHITTGDPEQAAYAYSSGSSPQIKPRKSSLKKTGEPFPHLYVFQPQPKLSTGYTAGLDVHTGYSTPPPGKKSSSRYKEKPKVHFEQDQTAQPEPFYKPPKRTFAEYLFLYTQRLRKKGKRVIFRPVSRDPYQQHQYRTYTPGMGSSHSKSSSSSPRNSRGRQYYSTTSKGGSYSYYIPQLPSYHTYSPESAYYLGTESIPPLHSLGRKSPPKKTSGSSSSGSGRTKYHHYHSGGTSSHKRGRESNITSGGQSSSSAYYYHPTPGGSTQPQPSSSSSRQHRHHEQQPTIVTAAATGGVYVLGADGRYYWQSAQQGSSARRSSKRERDESTTRDREGRDGGRERRDKKLRRAKAVEDMRGRSLRGGEGRWVGVTA